MNKVKCEKVSAGLIPTEKVARVRTLDGVEEVIVADTQAPDGYLLVSEIRCDNDKVLIELPREASSGAWRLWVSRDLVEPADDLARS